VEVGKATDRRERVTALGVCQQNIIPARRMSCGLQFIVQVNVDTSGVFMADQYREKRICTKTDNLLKAIRDAHLRKQVSDYS